MTNIPEMIFVKTEPLTLKSNSPGERLQDKRLQIQTDLREVKAQVEETDKKKIQQENVISEQDELTRKVSQGRRKIHDLQNKRKQIEIELTACKEDVFRLNSIIDDKSEERQEAVRALATIADITKDLRCRKRKLEEMLSLTQKDHILLRHISDRGIREIARHFGYSKAQYDGQDTFQCRALNNMAEGLETAEDLKAVSNMVHQINHDIEEQAPEKLIVEIEDEQGSDASHHEDALESGFGTQAEYRDITSINFQEVRNAMLMITEGRRQLQGLLKSIRGGRRDRTSKTLEPV